MARYIIKVGGTVLDQHDTFSTLLLDLKLLIQQGHSCVLVHGGGKQLSTFTQSQNIEANFDKEGRRVTSKQEMDCTDMILAGKINTNILRCCLALQIPALGLSGVDHGLVVGEALNNTYTGLAKSCNISIITILCDQSILPVVSPVSSTTLGAPLNVNADECAQIIAQTWNADCLLYISDIPGIVYDNKVLDTVNTQKVLSLISEKIIKDGMVAKSLNALEAIHKGVKSVAIGQFFEEGDLLNIINNTKGTKIHYE